MNVKEKFERLVGWFGIPPETDKRALCFQDIDAINKALDEGEEAKQVLEIIIKKKVNVGLVTICETYKDYCRLFVEEHKGMQPLTETEFNLIKERISNG